MRHISLQKIAIKRKLIENNFLRKIMRRLRVQRIGTYLIQPLCCEENSKWYDRSLTTEQGLGQDRMGCQAIVGNNRTRKYVLKVPSYTSIFTVYKVCIIFTWFLIIFYLSHFNKSTSYWDFSCIVNTICKY